MNAPMNDRSSTPPTFEAQVRRAVRDPVPAAVLDRSLAAGEWFAMDTAIATLTNRETVDAAAAGVRGVGDVTTLTFTHERLTIDVEIGTDLAPVVGQVAPVVRATVRLLSPSDTLATTATDGHGMFEFAIAPTGPFSLSIRRSDDGGELVRTEWSAV